MVLYKGVFFGYTYDIEAKNESEFKSILKHDFLRFELDMKEIDFKTTKTEDSIKLQILKEIVNGDLT